MGVIQVKVIRKADDPHMLRASIGGDKTVGYYCVYRGNKADVIACVQTVLEALTVCDDLTVGGSQDLMGLPLRETS